MISLIKLAVKNSIRSRDSLIVIAGMIFALIMPMITISISDTLLNNTLLKAQEIYGEFSNILYDAQDYQKELKLKNNVLTAFGGNDAVEGGSITYLNKQQIDGNEYAIGYADDLAIKLGHIKVIEGRFPKEKNEIVLTFSANYKLGKHQVGDDIVIGNDKFIICGIIADYSAVWSKPSDKNYAQFPNIFISYDAAKVYHQPISVYLLLEENINFNSDVYKDITDLVQNINLITEGNKRDYEIPGSTLILLFICSFLLCYYIVSFYFNKQAKSISILRCLCITRKKSIFYMIIKMFILTFIAVIVGILLGFIVSFLLLHIVKQFVDINSGLVISAKCIKISLASCISAIVVNVVIHLFKIYHIEPVQYLFDYISYTGSIKHRKSLEKITIFKLVIINLKSDLKKYVVAILLFAVSVTLFNNFIVYLNIYSRQKSEVNGRMPLDFDYEFTTNQTITDTSYVDNEGNSIYTTTVPTNDNIIYVPDYSKIIDNDIMSSITNDDVFDKSEFFLECTNLIMENQKPNQYTLGYNIPFQMDDRIKKLFHYPDNMMEIQAIGYDSDMLSDFDKYIADGEINVDKIISGEEVILMAPIYKTLITEDGTTRISHISEDEYVGSDNQFKDIDLKVGDSITISQIQTSNIKINGYLTGDQAKEMLYKTDKTVKIGAIIYERVGWFDNLTTVPTAYTILCHNKTFENLEIFPTHSRVRLYLNPSVGIEEAENIINSYSELLAGFTFRNNMIEMKSYREYKLILGLMYSAIIISLGILLFGMLLIQNKINVIEKRQYFALLKINGLDNRGIKKYFFIQNLIISGISIIITVPVCIVVLYALYSMIIDWTGALNIWLSGISVISIVFINIIATIPSLQYLIKKSVIDIIKE